MDSESAAAALPSSAHARRPIGEFLVERGLVTPDELAAALAQQRLSGQRLGEILVERGSISRMALASVLGEQWEEAGRHLRAVVPVRLADGKEADTGFAGGEELTESLAALQTAVARLEDLAGEADAERPSVSESSVAADVLVRMERLESWLREGALGDRLAAAVEDVRADLAEVRAVLAEPVTADDALTERLGRIEEALAARPADSTEERIAALDAWLRGRDDDALGESVTAALDQLRGRIDGLETAIDAPAERFERLEALLQERAAVAPDPVVVEALAELRGALDELKAAVGREPAPDGELHARLERIETALAERPVDESPAVALAELRAAVDAATAADPGVAEALADLRSEVRDVRAAVAREPAPDEELYARLGQLEAALARRPVDDSVAAALTDLRTLVEREAAPDPAVTEALGELRSGLEVVRSAVERPQPDTVLVESLEALRRDLDELRREPASDQNLRERLERIEAAVAEPRVDESLTVALHELKELVARSPAVEPALHERLQGMESALARLSTDGAVHERLERLDARLVAQAEDERVAEALHEVRTALDRQANASGPDLGAALGELRSNLEELRAAVDRPAVPDTALHSRLETIEASLADRGGDELVAELRTAVDRAAGGDEELRDRLGRIEGLLADLRSDEGLAGHIAELHAALERTVAERDDVDTAAALSTVSDRLVELRAAVDRPDASVAELRERLDRIEAALTAPRDDGLEERLHGIVVSLAELRDLVRSPTEPDHELHARLERIENLAAAHASRDPEASLERLAGELRDGMRALPSSEDDAERAARVLEAIAGLRDQLVAATPEAPDAGAIAGQVGNALGPRLDRLEGALEHALASMPLPPGAQEIAGLVEAGLGERLDRLERAAADPTFAQELAERLERIGVDLRGDLQAAVPDPPGADEIAARVGESLGDRFDAVDAAVRDRSADAALGERLERVAGELRDRIDAATPSVPDAGEIAGRVHDAVAGRLEGIEAAVRDRPEVDLIAALAARLDEIRGALDRDRDAELAEQLGRIESELRAGLPPVGVAVAAHAQQLEWLAGSVNRIDGELLGRLEQLLERVGGVEATVRATSPDAALAGLAERVERLHAGLEEPRDAEVRAQLDRLESALREVPLTAREAVAGHGAALGELQECLGRVETTLADRVASGQVERLEGLAAELRAALADPPGAATLSRLVAQSHNALAERIATFEQAVAGLGDASPAAPPVSPPPRELPAPAVPLDEPASFVALVPSPKGYRLVDLEGLLPARGSTVDVDGAERVVARLGRSPLPGDRRRCAFLEV